MINNLILTTAQREQLVQALTIPHRNAQAAKDMLQSLPMVSEPVSLRDAVFKVCEGYTLHEGARKILETALFTSPQALTDLPSEPRHPQFVAGFKSGHAMGRLRGKDKALTPITADDVTDEMVLVYYADFPYLKDKPNLLQGAKKDLVAAYNLVAAHLTKNRSEEK